MSKKLGVFICPSCQTMVQSDGPLEEGVTCGQCDHKFGLPTIGAEATMSDGAAAASPLVQVPRVPGRNPDSKKALIHRNVTSKRKGEAPEALELEKIQVVSPPVEEIVPEKSVESHRSRDEETILPDGSRRVRRLKKRPKKEKHLNLILFLAGWISVIAIIFFLFRLGEEKSAPSEEQEDQQVLNEQVIKKQVLRRFLPEVSRSFKRFLNHPTNNGREQFIHSPADLAMSFANHYRLNPFIAPRSSIKIAATNVIRLSEKDFGIETIWKDEEGQLLGAVHLWDGEGWKLDWENFARYSSISWSRFRSELGGREGQFRLLVRKRETEDDGKSFDLSFYRAPVLYEDADEYRVTESPEVEVRTESELGQEFLKLWEKHLADEPPFGSILAKALDPSNGMRINVTLAWEKNAQGESKMVLKEILGVSWFGQAIQKYRQNSLVNEEESDTVPLGE